MFKTNRVLIRIILSHLITGVLLTALLLLVVSSVITSRIEASTDQSARTLLRQTYQTTYNILNDVYGDFYTLWTKNGLTAQALGQTGVPAADEPEVSSILAVAALNDEAVYSVQLINRITDKVYSDRAEPTSIDGSNDPGANLLLQEFALHFDEYRDQVFFPRTIQVESTTGLETVDLLSIIYATKAGDGTFHSGLIVNIDRSRLVRMVNLEEPSGQLLMISSSGRLIAALAGKATSQDFSGETSISSILSGSEAEGSLTGSFMGEKNFLIYKKADTLGFTFIRAIPYSILKTEAQNTNRIVGELFIVAMLLSLLISIYSTWKIYYPLNLLVTRMRDTADETDQPPLDEYAFMQAAYTALSNQNRQSGLIRLIHGQIDETTIKGLRMNRARFLTLAIVPDHAEETGAQFIDQLNNLAARIYHWHSMVSAPDCVSVVLNEDSFDERVMEKLEIQISELQRETCAKYGISVSVGLGTVVEDVTGVRASHRYALIAVQHALSLGENQMVPYGEIENTSTAASQNRTAITAAIDEYIQNNLKRAELTQEDIASHIGLSVGYMRQIFRMERGIPVNDHITASRISKAQTLLATTDLTAKKIAEEVGYADSRYFYTLFKKKTGETTEEYRSRLHQSSEEQKIKDQPVQPIN